MKKKDKEEQFRKKREEQYQKYIMNMVIKPQDRLVPHNAINKLMRNTIDKNSTEKVSISGKNIMLECVTEFIGFITQEALDRVEFQGRKVMCGEDIIWAMQNLGFDPYIEHLVLELKSFREKEKEKKMNQPSGRTRKTRKRKEKKKKEMNAPEKAGFVNEGFLDEVDET